MPRNHIIPIFIPHAGCPHSCVFCDQHAISGTPHTPSPEEVAQLARAGAEKNSGNAELAFYGGSFTCLPTALQEAYLRAVQPLRASCAVGSIRVSTRPDAVTPEILALLKRFGVETVELGCQSMDNRVLALAGRGHTEAQIVGAVRAVQSAGLKVIMQLMFGLPGDTPESAAETCRKAAGLRPDGVRFYPVVVLRNTPLAERLQEGTYVPLSVEEAVSLCADLLPVFVAARIPVIRLGLNPTEDLSGGTVLGGAYHPALGELTWSRYFRNAAEARLSALEELPRELALVVHESRCSVMAGQHRQNTEALKRRFGLKKIRILPGNPDPFSVKILLF